MCGIVGLFLKDQSLQPELGALLTDMLVTMSDRGPDSAGIAVYRGGEGNDVKITVQSSDPATDFDGLGAALGSDVRVIDTHAIVTVPAEKVDEVRRRIAEDHPALRIMSSGDTIEIYKEVGLPQIGRAHV